MKIKKLLVLFLKVGLLLLLSLLRLDEITLSLDFLSSKYRIPAAYYIGQIESIAIFLLLLDFMQFSVVWFYRRRNKLRGNDNFIVGISNIYLLLVVVGIIVGLLSLFQINARELFTSLSIIFAGLAILTKDYISNMISGMIIAFSGEYSIGDNVRIGNNKGRITDITLQNIHLQNDDDDMIFIPNSMVITHEVVNYTKREIKRTSIDFEIDLKYITTIEQLEDAIIESLLPFKDLIKEDSYYLRVAEVRKDNLSLKFQYILKEPNKELERTIRRRAVRRLVEIISDRDKAVHQINNLPE
ncbi:MAG: mechanosensitive ion channel [Lewinellaceae bacterium]|nr:mechanosensitive ion channel [Lewinellaceae bacterium]